MTAVAHIEHRLPGRVRLRVPSKRGDVPFFERLVKELSRHPAVWELVASPLTGSIVLQYSEPLEAIMEAAADVISVESGWPKTAAKGKSQLAGRVGGGTGLAGHVAAGLSGLSLYQAARGNVVGTAVENFWLSFSARSVLGRPDIATVFAAVGLWQMLRGKLFGSAGSLFFYSMVMRQVAAMESTRSRLVASRPAKPANQRQRAEHPVGA